MLIACPNCSTSYEIDISKLTPHGRSVRCTRCQETWFAESPIALLEPEANAVDWAPAPSEPSPMFEPVPSAAQQDEVLEEASAGDDDTTVTDDLPPAEIDDAPPLAPLVAAVSMEHAVPAEAEPAGQTIDPAEDIESFAARRARIAVETKSRRRRRAKLPLAILGVVAVLAGLIGWRTQVVRIAPQTAQIYSVLGMPVNLRGLAFSDITISDETKDGVPVMVVQGRITNTVRQAAEVPRLRFAVRNKDGIEVYAWTALPERPFLNPGETLDFRSRLASPPTDAKDVLVRFFHRRDLVANQ